MLKKLSILVSILLLIVFFLINKNQNRFLLSHANSCFEKNNIQCAQENYEKAFAAGVYDGKARDIYVNSIINAPLDLKAQEKIVKFLSYGIEDGAKLKIDYFLHDLKLEIFRSYPGNYVKQAVYNRKVVRWGKIPIKYDIVAATSVLPYFEAEVENAINMWEKVLEHQILFEKDEANPDIIIKFEKTNPAKGNQKYVSAYTTPDIVGNKLKKMEIKFYTTDPNGNDLTQNQIYNTALHEISHALGVMGHSDDEDNIMYMTKDSATIWNDIRESLSDADINTIKLLYKIKPDITNSDELKGEYLPIFILGTEDELNLVKQKEARNYIENAPTISAGYIDLAESYIVSKNYPKAIKVLEHALKFADNDEIKEMICYNLAVSYYYIDHLELAKEYLLKSIQLKDGEEKSFLLAEIYNKSEDYRTAEKEYLKLINLNPTNPEYTIALANLYINNKKFLKARGVLKNYFELNPSDKKNSRFKPYGILLMFL